MEQVLGGLVSGLSNLTDEDFIQWESNGSAKFSINSYYRSRMDRAIRPSLGGVVGQGSRGHSNQESL